MNVEQLWEKEIIIDESATKEYLQKIVEHKQKYSNKPIFIVGKSGIPTLVDEISKKGDKYIIRINLKKIAREEKAEKIIRVLCEEDLKIYNAHPYIQIQY